MNYYLSMQGQVIGPMTAQQVMSYNVNPNVQVSSDGMNWQPLYAYPELMQLYQSQRNYAARQETDSKKIITGIMALLFGWLGIQYFIIGKIGAGFVTILLSIVTCGFWEIVTFIQGIMILCMSDEEFKRKYIDSPSFMPLF